MMFRKAILLIHGFAGGNYDFGELGNELQFYLGFDVFTFTLPGHDKNIITNVTRKDWINASEEMIKKIINKGYKTIYVVGHSMGGIIASHLASKYKEIKKLVLASPAFRYFIFKDNKLDLISSIKNSPKIFKDYPIDEVISRIFKVPIRTALEFIELAKESEKDLKNINCPTLILQGENDKIAPKESTEYVYDNIVSNVKLLINFEGAGHDIFTGEKKEIIIDEVISFLRKKHLLKKEIINK